MCWPTTHCCCCSWWLVSGLHSVGSGSGVSGRVRRRRCSSGWRSRRRTPISPTRLRWCPRWGWRCSSTRSGWLPVRCSSTVSGRGYQGRGRLSRRSGRDRRCHRTARAATRSSSHGDGRQTRARPAADLTPEAPFCSARRAALAVLRRILGRSAADAMDFVDSGATEGRMSASLRHPAGTMTPMRFGGRSNT